MLSLVPIYSSKSCSSQREATTLSTTARIHQLGRVLLLFTSLLLLVMFFSAPALATVVTCNSGTLTSADATTDLEVTGPCEVPAGTYVFHSVNIYSTNPGATPG